ncbi:MAG TPA: response regulator [Candidatus Paceibacterota bacterium]|nr:response regulator [Candidatus Paceibacterota bacterium]
MREKPLILIVDDEASLREIMSVKLNASGFSTLTASNAKEGFEEAVKSMPDLVLMDIHMPDATGTDAALAIKQNEATKNIKIAFLTNLRDPWPAVTADRDKLAKSLGMEEYIEKTDDLDSIAKKVKEVLSRDDAVSAGGGSSPEEKANPPK